MKVYLRTEAKVSVLASTYAQVFNGKVLKHAYRDETEKIAHAAKAWTTSYDYAYLETETKDRFMIARYGASMPKRGYNLDIILTYQDEAVFNAAFERLNNHPSFKVDYGITHYDFNTLAKFYDEWGYGWVIELNRPVK